MPQPRKLNNSMGDKPTVLFLTGSLGAGGLERFVSKVAMEEQHRSRFKPVIVCLSNKAGLFVDIVEKEGVQVLEAPKRWQRSLIGLFKLGRLIRVHKPLVVHSQVNFSLFQQFLAVSLYTKARFLVTERNCYPLKGWALIRRKFQFYSLIFFGVQYSGNSIDVVNHLSGLMGYPKQKIPVIPNGIEIPPHDHLKRRMIRVRHGWREEDFVVGYVSRFASHKGQGYFLEVMQIVYAQLGNKLKVCFIGDGPERNRIELLASSSPIANLTSFLGIIENVNDYYKAFDCLALFSSYEGMPNVVIEAMAHGVPIVANPVGNVAELFDGGGGIINQFDDPAKTARLILDLAEHPVKREEIGKNAEMKVQSSFSLRNTRQLLYNYYGIG